MKTYKTKPFGRFARRQRIGDSALCGAIRRAEQGQIDADLGGGVIKQRIARPHEGKSSGFRAIIFYFPGKQAFFAFGFAKSDRENITESELEGFKKLADRMLSLSSGDIAKALSSGAIAEVECDEHS